MEFIVVIVFWILLYNHAKDLDDYKPPWKKLRLVIDHCIPSGVILIDYVFLSAVPICRRHFPFILSFEVLYLVVNYIAVQYHGDAIYPFLTWKGLVGAVLWPLTLLLVSLVTLLGLEQINYKKLSWLGYQDAVDVLKGKGLPPKPEEDDRTFD